VVEVSSDEVDDWRELMPDNEDARLSGVYDAFLSRFVERVEGLELGASFELGPDVGSLVSASHMEDVEAHLAGAVDRGAVVETGGKRAPDVGPLFFEPTVVTEVPGGSDLADEETFGPVVRIESVPDVETAIERANDSDYAFTRASGPEIASVADRSRSGSTAGPSR
jgi:acyl-CoA reductase-like NAD-dependent aldehyde dehydrogenase